MLRALGIGCGLFAFGAMCLLGLALPAFCAMSEPASDAATGFLSDVRDRSYSDALARMSSSYQSTHNATQLQTSVEGLDSLESHTFAMITNAESHDDGHVTVEGSLYGPDGETPVAFEVSEVNGYWYIDLVAVGGRAVE